MARLITDGAETQDLLLFSSASCTNSSTNPRSGSRCYQYTQNQNSVLNVPNLSELYYRAAIRIESAFNFQWQLRGGAGGTTQLAAVSVVSGTGEVTVNIGGGAAVITSATPLQLSQYFVIELYYKLADSNGAIELKLDGVSQGTYSGDTKPGTDTVITNIYSITSQSGVTMRIDDIALNDTTGGADNSWCGDGKVVLLSPNAAGNSAQWSRGGADSGSNYGQADELPPNGDTDFVYDSVSGHVDQYNLSTFTIPANHVVTRVVPIMVSREETAAGDSIQLGIRSNTTEDYSSNIPQTTVYSRYEGKSYTTDPATSAAWGQAGIDALQVGIKIP